MNAQPGFYDSLTDAPRNNTTGRPFSVTLPLTMGAMNELLKSPPACPHSARPINQGPSEPVDNCFSSIAANGVVSSDSWMT